MKINNELIDKIASLSKLEFEGEEKAAIKSDLTRMLDFIEKLQSVPTEGVEPLIYMTDEKGKTRLDESKVTISKEEALKNADFVYVKNWSSYNDYGKVLNTDPKWMITKNKLGNAKFMHCLPVRRNLIVEDAVLDSENSLVIQQANNRTFAAQLVLKKLLENA